MPNILTLSVDNPDEILNAGAYGAGALMRVQSAATEAGVYADLSGTGSTPTILIDADERSYVGYDPNGAASTWYRTRYESATATRLSDWSTSFQIGTPARLATLGQVKARLGIATTDDADDGLLSDMIDEVSAWIESYTGRWFTPRDGATYVVDTYSGYVLRIPQGIRAVTSMGIATLAQQPDSGGTYTTLSAATIMLRPASLDRPTGWPATEIRLSRATSYSFGTIENGATITGDFGFASVPLDIRAVCIDAVTAAYTTRRNGTSGVIGAEEYAVVPWVRFFSKGSPQRGTLDRYREIGIG